MRAAAHPNIAPATSEPVLVEIDARMIPVVLAAIEQYKLRKLWQSDQDWQYGVLALNGMQEALLTGTQNIADAIDRLYRLVDTALNGAAYSSSPNPSDPERPIVSPAIPAAPESVGIGQAPGLRAQLLAAQGTINAGWFGIGGEPATLADVVTSLRIASQGDTQRITDAINAIAGDSELAQLSQAANIFNTVKGLFEDVAEGVSEGAVLGTLIASTIATSGMLGVLAGQLDKLAIEIRASRGGSNPDPDWKNVFAQPDELGLSTIGGVIIETAAVNDKLEAVRLLVEGLQNAQTLQEIRDKAGEIALLLA